MTCQYDSCEFPLDCPCESISTNLCFITVDFLLYHILYLVRELKYYFIMIFYTLIKFEQPGAWQCLLVTYRTNVSATTFTINVPYNKTRLNFWLFVLDLALSLYVYFPLCFVHGYHSYITMQSSICSFWFPTIFLRRIAWPRHIFKHKIYVAFKPLTLNVSREASSPAL